MAVLGPHVSVNMNGHNNIHSQLTKSLERILEDGFLSGELKLSGRKLREFPKPVKYDLSDTVVADLSKNRFSELPDEVTSYVFLEKLLLSQNVIRTVPNAVGGLQSLTYLDLRHGDLSKPISNARGRIVTIQRWEELTSLLNSDGSGDTKSTEKWKKVWSDFKNNTKKKAARLHRAASGTGGGPAVYTKLTELEKRVLNVIGIQAATGLVVPEAGFSQDIRCLRLRLRLFTSSHSIPYNTVIVQLRLFPITHSHQLFMCHYSNQLTELPREVCQMPLQVLLLPDNLLTTLPKEIGKMTSLAELDASNNRLTQVPMTLGDCVGMRALDLSKNQLGLLPLQITYLRLEHLDVSCNCISSLPLELRNMSTLVTLNLDNNPLVSPPTTICMRGRVHIFKYLENMANKDVLPNRRVEDTRRNTKHNSYTAPNQNVITSGNATIDCLRHKPRHVVDSGYCTDGVEKRWSNEGTDMIGSSSGRSTPSTPSTLSPGAALSRAQSLSSDAPLAPLTPLLSGVRISPEGTLNGDDKSKLNHQQTYRQYKEALRQQRQQDIYRPRTDQNSPELDSSPQSQSPIHKSQSPNGYSNISPSLYRSLSSNSNTLNSTVNSVNSLNSPNSPNHVPNSPSSPLLHSTPRKLVNGNTDKDEPKRPVQKVVPSRNVNKVYTNGNGNEYNRTDTYIKPTSPTKSPTNTIGYTKSSIPRVNGETKLLTTSVSYVKGAAKPPPKMAWNKDASDKLSFTMKREFDKQKEESDLLLQLRTILESRLKMSLPESLSGVLRDGVVLCHLANHVRPRSVASVHVPSPAQPKLTMARCRRNVDNFLEACRKIGVEEGDICSAEDILHRDELTLRLARTVVALTHAQRHTHHEYTQRYPEQIYNYTYTDHQQYIFDENEEYYESNYENNNELNSVNELRNRGPYYQKNKVQFVQPFCKEDHVLKSDNFEIYDTDVVDCPMDIERYDRNKMNLDIQNNLNDVVIRTETPKEREDRIFYTCLCLGMFFISAILLILYPL